MIDCAALVVAAGRGSRFGGELPKQYTPVCGAPLLRHTVRHLLDSGRIDRLRVVIGPEDEPHYRAAVGDLGLLPPVTGGATRQESVLAGLESLAAMAPRHVLIHDAARPLVPPGCVAAALAALADAPAAVVAVPVTDTLKRGADGRVAGTVDRAGLWRAQTPQAFRFADILAAHRAAAALDPAARATLTDDAIVAERAGLPVALVPGSEDNIKVTTADDLARLRRLLRPAAPGEIRTGTGFDVHGFGPGDHVTLCGVRVPHDKGLMGHSDADVALHALTDALLGAIGGGDIGQHFPPSDARWRGADSRAFLRHAAALVAARNGRIVNLDVTLICERPKIGPHRDAMVQAIAETLGIAPGRVNVKATTTEKLGFTGRGEGIAAQAVATIALPLEETE